MAEVAHRDGDGGSPHEGLTTPERLLLFRRRRQLTLRKLAVETGISHSTLASYERGDTEPSGESIRKLALALGVSSDYLLRLKATPSKLSGKRTSAKRGMSSTPKRPIANDLPLQAPLLQTVK